MTLETVCSCSERYILAQTLPFFQAALLALLSPKKLTLYINAVTNQKGSPQAKGGAHPIFLSR